MNTPPLLCAALEIALNRLLRLEPAALEQCVRLQGRALALEASDLGWRLTIEPTDSGVRVLGADDAPPADVIARAPSARLLTLALQMTADGGALPPGLEIVGDTELLLRFTRILSDVGFDPEEWAARLVGDVAAHRLVERARSLLGWGRRSADALSYSTAEYLREETEDLARASDVEAWSNDVDRLRDGVDRLDARLRRLEASRQTDATS